MRQAYKYSKIKNTIKGTFLEKSCVFAADLQFLRRDKWLSERRLISLFNA
jgi:hypothetical protein